MTTRVGHTNNSCLANPLQNENTLETVFSYLIPSEYLQSSCVNKVFHNATRVFNLKQGRHCVIFSSHLKKVYKEIFYDCNSLYVPEKLAIPFFRKLKIEAPLDPGAAHILLNYLPEMLPNIDEIKGNYSLTNALLEVIVFNNRKHKLLMDRQAWLGRVQAIIKGWPKLKKIRFPNSIEREALQKFHGVRIGKAFRRCQKITFRVLEGKIDSSY